MMSFPPLKVGSACFGIGGLDLGLSWAGMVTVWLIEKNPKRRAWARRNFPEAMQYDDMRRLDAEGYAGLDPVDLVCGGIPCQPASLSGKRKGQADDRWLWPEAVRLMAALRPTWGLFENPVGFVTLGLDGVLSDLEGLGYAVWPVIIPACAVDAPHRRDRVFILAHSDCIDDDRRGHGPSDVCRLRFSPSDISNGGIVGDTNRQGLSFPQQYKKSEEKEREQYTRPTARQPSSAWSDSEWITGAEGKSRRTKPGVRLLAHGVPGRVAQISGFGDAVVPYVAYEIGRSIMAAHYGIDVETLEVASSSTLPPMPHGAEDSILEIA